MTAVHALLVGIDTYPPPVPPLAGCVNDVEIIGETLRVRVPQLSVLTLTNEQATRAAVTAAIREHLGGAGPDDTALLYFSGHGSQQQAPPELWGKEPDRRNETLVLFDSRSAGGWDLADKELAALLDDVAHRVAHLLVVLDCCHSGDGTRDANGSVRLRLAPEDKRPRPFASFVPEVVEAPEQPEPPEGAPPTAHVADAVRGDGTRALGGRWTSPGSGHVLLAACRASETAKELTVAGRPRGALSAALDRALRQATGQPTYRDIHRLVTAGVLARVEDQNPQLETTDATDLDRTFLGGALPARPRQLTLSHLPDGWWIDAGAVHGVPDPIGDDTTELAIYALAGATDGAPLASADVTRVLPDRSLVSLDPDLDPGYLYRAVVKTIPLNPLDVAIAGDEQERLALRAAAAQADSTLVRLVDDPGSADLVVQARADGFEIRRPGVTRPLVPVVAGPAREERTIVALQRVARWLRLLALTNPATQLPENAVSVAVVSDAGRLTNAGRLEISYAGSVPPTFTVTLTNTTELPLWCALLDLTEAYGIFTDAFPAGSVSLDPGASVDVALTGQLSDALWNAGTVAVVDHLKIITSTLEFDPRSLEQPELDVDVADAPVVRSAAEPRSTLERLLVRVTTRRATPAAAAPAVADWRSDDLDVVTHRAAAEQ